MMSIVNSLGVLLIFCGLNIWPAIAQIDDPVIAEARVADGDEPRDIGGGLYLLTTPAVYETVVETVVISEPDYELIVIPAVYETIVETKIIHPARIELKVLPPVYDGNGALKSVARAELIAVPAITKDKKRRVVKIPARVEKRYLPSMGPNNTKRVVKIPESYKVLDSLGNIVVEYDNKEELAAFLNTRNP